MQQKLDTEQNLSKPIEQMSFEEALFELETIVKKLETGKEPLEHALNFYELGNKLKQHCEKKLKEAQLRVDRIMQKEDGSLKTEKIDDTL